MANKAREVYTTETLALQDGTTVEVRPLPIKRLKVAQKIINDAMTGVPQVDDNGEPVLDEDGEQVYLTDSDVLTDAFFQVVEMVMKNQAGCEKFLEPESGRGELEDTLDQDTMYEIVRVATGYDFLAFQRKVQEAMENGSLPI